MVCEILWKFASWESEACFVAIYLTVVKWHSVCLSLVDSSPYPRRSTCNISPFWTTWCLSAKFYDITKGDESHEYLAWHIIISLYAVLKTSANVILWSLIVQEIKWKFPYVTFCWFMVLFTCNNSIISNLSNWWTYSFILKCPHAQQSVAEAEYKISQFEKPHF